MKLLAHTIHIWSGTLAISDEQEASYQTILSSDEIKRANQFKFAKDKRHFIAARFMLRKLLSLYINKLPIDIRFQTSEHGKPFLVDNDLAVEFNVSHSGELAVYAFGLTHPLGIDTEKMQIDYPAGVAEKYFSASERQALTNLPETEQYKAFYRLWASKEALIKATGKGLFISLSNISVSLLNDSETIELENTSWLLKQLPIHPDYQSAIACHPSIKDLLLYTYQHV